MTNSIIPSFSLSLPRYLALAKAIEDAIASGQLAPGQQLPTHRDLAASMGVTVGTITRGYGEAQKRGLINSTVGRGTFVNINSQAGRLPEIPKKEGSVIEMGSLTPLYAIDPPIQDGLKQLMEDGHVQQTLQYCDAVGHEHDRKSGAKWLELYGMQVTENAVIICAGVQHALTCILTALLHSGDSIAVEHLTYPGFKTLAGMLGMRLVPIAMNDEGMDPQALDAVCKKATIRAIFVMPGHQNPTTSCMSQRRRNEIVQVAQKHDLLIIEDCAYDLSASSHFTPLAAIAPDQTVLIAGISKYFGAGLRTSYLTACPELRNKLGRAVRNTIWMTSPITARLASMFINDGSALSSLINKKEEARLRNQLAQEILQDFEIDSLADGFFMWLKLPEPWTGSQLEMAARERNVSIFCADKFAVGTDPLPRAVRLSLTGPEDRNELQEGLTIIRELLSSPPMQQALL